MRTRLIDKPRKLLEKRRQEQRALDERLLEQTAPDRSHAVKTRTKKDVGEWFRRARIWLCACGSGLVLCARGKRSYREEIAFSELSDILYNHITGELVLVPANGEKPRAMKISPLEAAGLENYLPMPIKFVGFGGGSAHSTNSYA